MPITLKHKIIFSSGNELKAHTYVLALASPVFKRQFFGAAKETKDVTLIEQTTENILKLIIQIHRISFHKVRLK